MKHFLSLRFNTNRSDVFTLKNLSGSAFLEPRADARCLFAAAPVSENARRPCAMAVLVLHSTCAQLGCSPASRRRGSSQGGKLHKPGQTNDPKRTIGQIQPAHPPAPRSQALNKQPRPAAASGLPPACAPLPNALRRPRLNLALKGSWSPRFVCWVRASSFYFCHEPL